MPEEISEAREEQLGAPAEDTQATEQAEGGKKQSQEQPEKEAAEQSKGRDSDATEADPKQAASAYKKLQGEYTRLTQELADLKRKTTSREADQARVAELEKKASALEKLAENPKFKAWAEQELLSQQYGAETWDELTPQQQLQYINTLAERKAEEIVKKQMAELRREYEPARQKAQEAEAAAAVQRVAEKYGDLWTDNLDAFKALISQYDQAALQNPDIKRIMDNPTEEIIETIFLRAIGPHIKDIGKKAYAADLEKKRKAQVADGKAGSKNASPPPARTIEEALAAAKQKLNVTSIESGE